MKKGLFILLFFSMHTSGMQSHAFQSFKEPIISLEPLDLLVRLYNENLGDFTITTKFHCAFGHKPITTEQFKQIVDLKLNEYCFMHPYNCKIEKDRLIDIILEKNPLALKTLEKEGYIRKT